MGRKGLRGEEKEGRHRGKVRRVGKEEIGGEEDEYIVANADVVLINAGLLSLLTFFLLTCF